MHTQGEVVNTGQDVYTVNYGDPSSLLAGPQPNILLVQLEGAQTVSPETLPSALRDCYLLHTKITGVKSLVATVQYDFAATPEMSAIHNSFTINGMLSSDGRFSVSNSYSSLDSEDGTSNLATDDLAFDGASFFWGTRGSPFYNAYSSSSALAQPAMGCQARFMDPLIGWAYSPFWITLFPGTTYTSFVVQALGETSIVQVTQTDPQMPSSGTTVYTISAGAVTHPTRIDTLDHDGNLVRRRDFSGYRSLATDVWRPMVVVESLYVPGTSSPYLVKTLTITSAVVLSASEANSPFPCPQSATNQWFVRR